MGRKKQARNARDDRNEIKLVRELMRLFDIDPLRRTPAQKQRLNAILRAALDIKPAESYADEMKKRRLIVPLKADGFSKLFSRDS